MMKKAVTFSIILAGFIAMASQIVLVRELLVVFYGNELSVAFMLASWLIAGALGSAVLGARADRIRSKVAVFSVCLLVLAALLPLAIILIRSLRTVLGVNPGEAIPLFPVMVSSFCILAPACALLGFMFVIACRTYEIRSGSDAARTGMVYVLEAIGAMAGGLVTSFALVRVMGSLQIMAMLAFLAAGAALALILLSKEAPGRFCVATVAVAMILMGALATFFGGWAWLDRSLTKAQWRGYELLASKNSLYGNIAVVKRGDQFSFFDNGLHLYTIPDRQSAEEAVHFALLEHPKPRSVLLIGGGVGGLIQELLKHPVEKIDYVEFDPLIVEMARRFLPGAYYEPLTDARVSVISGDGRRFIKTAGRTYDVIIVSLGDPYTAQLNRFYTAEFFGEASRALNEGGVLSFGLSSSESYIGMDLAEFLRSVYATLKTAFPGVIIIPGETAFFLATGTQGLLTYDHKALMDRAKARGVDLQYVREYYLASRLAAEKTASTERAVAAPGGAVNRDLRPVSYYYDIVFWTTRFKGSLFSKALKAVTERLIWAAALVTCAAMVIWGLFGLRSARRPASAIICSVVANGFSQMTFQIVILLAFQALYGYLYYKIGLILTAFMAGIALGGWRAAGMVARMRGSISSAMAVQAFLMLFGLLAPLVFRKLAISGSSIVCWMGENVIFALLPLVSGFAGAFLFPVATKIRLEVAEGAGRTAGLIYGADLSGSCLGAFLAGAFLIPVIGMPGTCYIIAMLNAAVLALLALSSRPQKGVR